MKSDAEKWRLLQAKELLLCLKEEKEPTFDKDGKIVPRDGLTLTPLEESEQFDEERDGNQSYSN